MHRTERKVASVLLALFGGICDFLCIAAATWLGLSSLFLAPQEQTVSTSVGQKQIFPMHVTSSETRETFLIQRISKLMHSLELGNGIGARGLYL